MGTPLLPRIFLPWPRDGPGRWWADVTRCGYFPPPSSLSMSNRLKRRRGETSRAHPRSSGQSQSIPGLELSAQQRRIPDARTNQVLGWFFDQRFQDLRHRGRSSTAFPLGPGGTTRRRRTPECDRCFRRRAGASWALQRDVGRRGLDGPGAVACRRHRCRAVARFGMLKHENTCLDIQSRLARSPRHDRGRCWRTSEGHFPRSH